MSKTAPSRADPVVVFPLGRWCPPQETSQPHPPPLVGSGNGLLPDGTKPLPEPMLTYHHKGPVAFIWRHWLSKILFGSLRGQRVKSCAYLHILMIDTNAHLLWVIYLKFGSLKFELMVDQQQKQLAPGRHELVPGEFDNTVKPLNRRLVKFSNLNVACLVLQLSLLNPLKPGVKSRMKM